VKILLGNEMRFSILSFTPTLRKMLHIYSLPPIWKFNGVSLINKKFYAAFKSIYDSFYANFDGFKDFDFRMLQINGEYTDEP